MSGDVSFEQISLSSNDSWALLDVEEDTTESCVDVCVLDKPDSDRCYVCDKSLLETRFACPFCDQCFICAICKEAYTVQRIPPCSHSLPPGATVPMFYFDDSAGEDVLVMNPVHCVTSEETIPVSLDADCTNTTSEAIQSPQPDQSNDGNSFDEEVVRTAEPRSLTDHVREALNLSPTPTDGSLTGLTAEGTSESQKMTIGGTKPIDSVPFKRMISPKLWHPSDSSGGSATSNASSGVTTALTAATAAAAVLRPSVQLVLGSCHSSECRTSPSSSTCSRSPPSLSSSPMNVASRIFKSVAMHSAAAMNNFDCMPMDGFDTRPVAKTRSTNKPSTKSQPTTPPSSLSSGLDDRFLNGNEFINRFIWDNEKLQSLIKPKPIPQSVIEQSAYNLR